MRQALWPSTIGYFMEQLMNPWTGPDGVPTHGIFSAESVDSAR